MSFAEMLTTTSPAFLTAFGESIPVKLHGILDFTIQAIYNTGGEEMILASGEVVVTRPTIYADEISLALISKDHTLTMPDGEEMKIFGGPVPDGTGNATQTVVRRG